jgi:hypothetical protein
MADSVPATALPSPALSLIGSRGVASLGDAPLNSGVKGRSRLSCLAQAKYLLTKAMQNGWPHSDVVGARLALLRLG